MADIKALTFDTGGTILDWHSGISKTLARLGQARGVDADWAAITNAYRRKSLQEMTGGDASARPDGNIDQVHRRVIEDIAREHGLSRFTDADFDEIQAAWHALECWPDVPSGLRRLRKRFIVASLTILSVRLIIDTSKRADLVWDVVISCEMLGIYKPRAEAYRGAAQWLQLAPDECLMVAAHQNDLAAAARVGFATAYIKRPDEWGNGQSRRGGPFELSPTYVADSFEDLANQLGCPPP